MNAEELKELDEIEKLASDVSSIISITKSACQANDFTSEESVLGYALDIQNQMIEKLINLNMSCLP